MVHLLDGPCLSETGQPVIAPARAHFRLHHVLRNGRHLRAPFHVQGSSHSMGNSASYVTAMRDGECRALLRYQKFHLVLDLRYLDWRNAALLQRVIESR